MTSALVHISLKKINKVHPKIKMREHIHFLLKWNANLLKYVAKVKAFKNITLILYTKITYLFVWICKWNVYNTQESEFILNKSDTPLLFFSVYMTLCTCCEKIFFGVYKLVWAKTFQYCTPASRSAHMTW